MLSMTCVIAACQPHASPATTVVPSSGTYTFDERVTAAAGAPVTTIQGTVHFTGDTILVEAQPGPCHYDAAASTPTEALVYACADVHLNFDRRDPVGRATYVLQTTVTENKTTCIRYTTNSAGVQVCAQTAVEPVDRKVTVSAKLRLIPATP